VNFGGLDRCAFRDIHQGQDFDRETVRFAASAAQSATDAFIDGRRGRYSHEMALPDRGGRCWPVAAGRRALELPALPDGANMDFLEVVG
jgi:hypothetical protein